MPARSEPLLWVQLIGAGLLPLEALLLLLLLAGSDPGPVPGLERLLCWALGSLAPALLLWKRPADVWSLLLLKTPLRGRRPLQQRLSRLQDALPPRLGLVLGAALSLPLLWWLDDHAAAAGSLTPLGGSPRLVLLLLAALLLALMQWQWQQLLQSLWLLSRSPAQLDAAQPMTTAELEDSRLCLGLPLLLLDPLRLEGAVKAGAAGSAGSPVPDPLAAEPPVAAAGPAGSSGDASAAAGGASSAQVAAPGTVADLDLDQPPMRPITAAGVPLPEATVAGASATIPVAAEAAGPSQDSVVLDRSAGLAEPAAAAPSSTSDGACEAVAAISGSSAQAPAISDLGLGALPLTPTVPSPGLAASDPSSDMEGAGAPLAPVADSEPGAARIDPEGSPAAGIHPADPQATADALVDPADVVVDPGDLASAG
jgi:hypothetical protein